MVRLEVRDADRAGAPVAIELLQGLPRRHVVAAVPCGQRPVDQEQVDVLAAERAHRPVEGMAGVIGVMVGVAQLAGDEHIAAGETGLGDGVADLLLVAVHLRGIDVPVAGLQGGGHGLDGVPRVDLEDAEAELGDRPAVVQQDAGYLGHDGFTPRFMGCLSAGSPVLLPMAGGFIHSHSLVYRCADPQRYRCAARSASLISSAAARTRRSNWSCMAAGARTSGDCTVSAATMP